MNITDFIRANSHVTNEEMLRRFAAELRQEILTEIADDYLYYLDGDEGSERLDEEKFFKEVYPLTNIK